MRLFFVCLVFITFSFSEMTQLSDEWYRNLDEAKAKAIEMKKPILLFIHSRNCFYCPKMIAKVFPDPKLSKQLRRDFILLSLDGSTDADSIEEDVNDQAPERFITSVTPAIFFMGPNEEKLTKLKKRHMVIYGYWSPQDLSQWADDALKRFKKYYGDKYGL